QKTREAMRLQKLKELREKISASYKKPAAPEAPREVKETPDITRVSLPPMDPEVARRSMEGPIKGEWRYIKEKLAVGVEKTNEMLHRTPFMGMLMAKLERQQIRTRNAAPI